MDKTELDRQIAVMQAYRDGAEIECRGVLFATPWYSTATPAFDWSAHDYRVKSKPKLRPWTFDEIPVGATVRLREGPVWRNVSVIYSKVGGLAYIACYSSHTNPSDLLSHYEVSYDNCKTWHPCGVLEEAK